MRDSSSSSSLRGSLDDRGNLTPQNSNALGSFNTTSPLQDGDFLMPFVEKHLADGALHGLYSKFSDVKDTLLKEEHQKLATLSAELKVLQDSTISSSLRETETNTAISLQQTLWNNITETITNIKSDLANLLARITNTETQITTIQDSILSGSFTIPVGSKTANIIYATPFTSTPSAQITLASPLIGKYILASSTPEVHCYSYFSTGISFLLTGSAVFLQKAPL